MGMDVLGRARTAKVGGLFSVGSDTWHELWGFARHVSETARDVVLWDSNSGDGLCGWEAKQVAVDLRRALSDDRDVTSNERLWRESVERLVDFLDHCGGFEIH